MQRSAISGRYASRRLAAPSATSIGRAWSSASPSRRKRAASAGSVEVVLAPYLAASASTLGLRLAHGVALASSPSAGSPSTESRLRFATVAARSMLTALLSGAAPSLPAGLAVPPAPASLVLGACTASFDLTITGWPPAAAVEPAVPEKVCTRVFGDQPSRSVVACRTVPIHEPSPYRSTSIRVQPSDLSNLSCGLIGLAARVGNISEVSGTSQSSGPAYLA